MILTDGKIVVGKNKAWFGSNKVELTKDTNTVYTHPSSIQCNASSEINSLKSSVSNGKSLIASAITGKGVSTASNATFQTMANNIGNISSVGEIEKIYLQGLDDKLYASYSDYDYDINRLTVNGPDLYEIYSNYSPNIYSLQLVDRTTNSYEFYYGRNSTADLNGWYCKFYYSRNAKTFYADVGGTLHDYFDLSYDQYRDKETYGTITYNGTNWDKQNHRLTATFTVTCTASNWAFDRDNTIKSATITASISNKVRVYIASTAYDITL